VSNPYHLSPKKCLAPRQHSCESSSQTRAAWRVNEFCCLIGISRTSFYKAVNAGAIRAVRIAGRTLVPRCEVARLLGEEEARRLE
jgi:hypothetical protein